MIQPGTQLEALIERTTESLLLVAPFIKVNALSRLFAQVDESVNVQVVTRWRVDEIAVGVSDLDVWLLVRDLPNSTLLLRSDLHAKYYRGDQRALAGSANLTNAALGWSRQPNLELLIESPLLEEFEQRLLTGSAQVDNTVYEQVQKIVQAMPTLRAQILQPLVEMDYDGENDWDPVSVDAWIPMLRHPEKLFVAYMGEFDELGTGSRIAAISDLNALNIPPGLNKEQFEACTATQLLQQPIIRKVDQFVETSQRFGAVRDLLRTLPCAEQKNFDSNHTWQTLMRWLLYFLPNRYMRSVPSHSEVFQRIL